MKATIETPTTKGTRTESGSVAWLFVGLTKVKFLIQDNGPYRSKSLTHFASGMKWGELRPTAAVLLLRTGHPAKSREVAQHIIERTVALNGLDKVNAILADAPVINR